MLQGAVEAKAGEEMGLTLEPAGGFEVSRVMAPAGGEAQILEGGCCGRRYTLAIGMPESSEPSRGQDPVERLKILRVTT